MNKQSTAVTVVQPREVIDKIEAELAGRRDQFLSLLGNDPEAVDRFQTLAIHAMTDAKLMAKLQKADLATVVKACRDCASLGLMPIPALAEAYFVPYWNSDKGKYDITLQTGYQGLAKLVRNSGRVMDIGAGVAYEADEFDYDEGSSAFIRHKRALANRGNRIAAYAIAWLPGGVNRVRVMDMAEVDTHRLASKAKDEGPWVQWYDAMAAKTVMRALAAQLPKSQKIEQALTIENEAEERHALPPVRRPDRLISSIHQRLGVTAVEADTVTEASGDPPDNESSDVQYTAEEEAELDAALP